MEDADEETNITIKLHPLVVLNISQHFTRIRKRLHFMVFGIAFEEMKMKFLLMSLSEHKILSQMNQTKPQLWAVF